MLTRDLIASCGHLDLLKEGDRRRLWSAKQLSDSLANTLGARPEGNDEVWVFGYGSLIWNPMVVHDESKWATLRGWRRRFSLRMTLGRGSEDRPGRMLAVEPGEGAIRGIAFRIPQALLHEELELLWRREMLTGAYAPQWATVVLDDNREVSALVFASNPKYAGYEPDSSVPTVAPMIASACGPYGSNAEYVLRLQRELSYANAGDEDIDALVGALQRLHESRNEL